MTSTILAGFDPGNSNSTLIVQAGTKQYILTIPSFVGSGSLAEIQRIRGGDNALRDGEFILEHEGNSYAVGKLAFEASDATSQRGDVERYHNGHTLRILLTLLASIIDDEEIIVRLATGLPVSLRSKSTADAVKASLTGDHQFTLNGRARRITVEKTFAGLMESGAASFVYGNKEAPHGIVDVGGRTTDLYWSGPGMQPVWERCHGAAIGIEKAGDYLRTAIMEQYGRSLNPDETRDILHAYARQQRMPTIYATGVAMNFNGHVERSIQRVADEVLSLISTHWRSNDRGGVAAEAANVILVGGGAHYLSTALRRDLPHLTVPDVPELANAEGYLAFAQQMTEEQWRRV